MAAITKNKYFFEMANKGHFNLE